MITRPGVIAVSRPVKPEPVKVTLTPPPKITWEHLVETVGKIAGWSEDQLKGYMQTYGYVWSPEIYWEIVITIRLNQRRAKENAEQPVGDWDRYYEFCPVCGEPTIPDPSRDRKFGAAFGWKCTVNPNHFIEWRFAHLKGYMTRHAGEIDKWEQAYGRGEYVQDEAG